MSDLRARRNAFTLIELLVVIAVITILAAMALPVLLTGMEQAGEARCKSNLEQLYRANLMYANYNDNFLPCYGLYANPVVNPESGQRQRRDATMLSTHSLIFEYVRDQDIYVCPADPTPENCIWWLLEHPELTKSSYMWNEHTMTHPNTVALSEIPVDVALIADGWECPNGWTWRTCIPPWKWPPDVTGGSRIDWEHRGAVNVLYAEGHVERVSHDLIADVRSNPR